MTIAPLPWARICAQFVLHAGPDAAQVDGVDRSKRSAGSSAASLGGIWMPALLNAMSRRPKVSTVRSTSAATCVLVGDVACDAEGLGDRRRSGPSAAASDGVLVDVGEDHGGAGRGEGPSGGQAHAGARAGDEGDWPVKS